MRIMDLSSYNLFRGYRYWRFEYPEDLSGFPHSGFGGFPHSGYGYGDFGDGYPHIGYEQGYDYG